jgi:hypothetical protein
MTKVLAGLLPRIHCETGRRAENNQADEAKRGSGEWACETRGRLRNDASAGGSLFCRYERLVCALDRCLMGRLINMGCLAGCGLAVIMGWQAHIGLFTVAPLATPADGDCEKVEERKASLLASSTEH